MKRFILFFLSVLVVLSSSYSYTIDTSTDVAYWDFEDSLGDLIGTNDRTLTTPTIDSSQSAFGSSSAHVNNQRERFGKTWDSMGMTTDYTIAFWFRPKDTGHHDFFSTEGLTSNFHLSRFHATGNRIYLYPYGNSFIEKTDGYNANQWYHYVETKDNNVVSMYVNGVLIGTRSNGVQTNLDFWLFGRNGDTATNVNGYVDDLFFSTNAKNQTEITDIYTNGISLFEELTEKQILHNISEFYNSENISIQINTTTESNLSYSLNNGTLTSICNNCTSQVLDLNSLSEGNYSIFLLSEDELGQENLTVNFTIDLTTPTINNNILNTYYSYNISSFNSSCNDLFLDYCNISLNNQNLALNSSNITLNNNGNITYLITAKDLAGNSINESGVLLINPRIFFNFNHSGTLIENYSFGNRADSSGFINYTIYNDGLIIGNNSLIFDKFGYILQNFSFTLNNSKQNNFSFGVIPARIDISLYDRESQNLLNQETIIQLIGPVGNTTSTNNGTAILKAINGNAGEYQLIIESENYTTETVYFNFNNQEILGLDVYLLSLDALDFGFVNIILNAETGQFISNAVCEAQEWIPSQSAHLKRAEAKTDTQGKAVLNIEVGTKSYKFKCSKGDSSISSQSQIISESGSNIPLTLPVGLQIYTPKFKTIEYDLDSEIFNSTHSRVFFTWDETTNVNVEACLKSYQLIGTIKNIIDETCSSTSSGEIQIITQTNNTYSLNLVGFINNQEVGNIVFIGDQSYGKQFQNYKLDILIPLIFMLIGISAGYFIKPNNIYFSVIAIMITTPFSLLIVPHIISFTIVVVVWVACLLMLFGGSRE
jgi:hypothetical protein